VGVVGGQFAGVLPSYNVWARDVYNSPIATLLISVTTVAYMVLTRHITGLIVSNLRAKIEAEESEKEGLLKKFSELNSTAQLGVLAHHIAHDLRGPIASISGYIEEESLKKKTAEEKSTLADLNEVVSNMAESLRGITRFGRVGLGSAEKISVRDFMDSLMAIVSFSPQAKGVKFEQHYSGKKEPVISGSRADLQQAYFNIIKNAVEAVRDNASGRLVRIEIRTDGDEAEISVSDNGPGIIPEIMDTLFKKSITTKKDGTGVGLLITRDLLAHSGGRIELHNLEGGGLRVITRLPLA
jgi:signal transduction histidine kinase